MVGAWGLRILAFVRLESSRPREVWDLALLSVAEEADVGAADDLQLALQGLAEYFQAALGQLKIWRPRTK